MKTKIIIDFMKTMQYNVLHCIAGQEDSGGHTHMSMDGENLCYLGGILKPEDEFEPQNSCLKMVFEEE